jgi:hypothetical protein
VASVSAIRDGLKTNLATITGLRAYDTVPGDLAVPAAVVEPDEPVISYDSTFARGSDELYFSVLVLVQIGTVRGAQDNLDAYLAGSGSGSIKAAVESDERLGGIVSYVRVTRADGYGTYEFNGIKYAGVRFRIEVLT